MLDRTYELIEAKKKQQEYNMSEKVSKYSVKNGYYDYNT